MAATCVNQRRLAAIGNYQLSSLVLGKGSFSRVEMANHVILNKKVALKVLTLSKIKDPYVLRNLQREANIMSRLNHPRVVALFEVCSSKDFFCLALDYFPGGNLCDLVQNHPRGRIEEEQARIFFKQMVEGLSYIHGEGIIHRDIKLENIYLNKEKTEVAIGDFGLSNFWQHGAHLKTRCGSAEYAAPEIFDKSMKYDQAVDIWSLGIVLYALISGRLPFEVEGENDVRELMKVINAGLTEQNMRNLGEVSMKSKLLISQLLQVDKESRITIPEIFNHIWLSTLDDHAEIDKFSFTMDLSMQMEVAKMVQEKLKLNHLTPNQILAYVMSAKGMFGKTAGCFNILARELVTTIKKDVTGANKVRSPDPGRHVTEVSSSSSSSKSKVTGSSHISNPISQQEKSLQTVLPSPALRNLDRLLVRKKESVHQYQPQQSSFWSSNNSRKPFTALADTKSRREEKENESRKKSAGKKARMEDVVSSENNSKRNLLVSGQGKVKRVEFDVDKVITNQDQMVRTSLATKQNII